MNNLNNHNKIYDHKNNYNQHESNQHESNQHESNQHESNQHESNQHESKITECHNMIDKLFHKYNLNEYMLQRIYNHISIHLPKTLKNEEINHEKRLNRNDFLTNEQQLFIQVFLNKNKYYYLPNCGFFYEYNGENYYIVREDDVIHKLLSTISKDRILLEWKHKTKLNIIKQIKERNLFTSIPETNTIQNVLNLLYPSFLSSKNAAKYFLTIIGDNILKKNTNLIYLVSNQMKQFVNELDNISIASIGNNNSTYNFMTKYHENHCYDNCRLIRINEKYINHYWREILKKIGLNLLCVAVHYSKRYLNADYFLDTICDEELYLYAYHLKKTNQTDLVIHFSNEYLQTTSEEYKIEWKNLHFVWKQFLSNNHFPNIIYSNTLKNIFKKQFIYEEQTDSFIGITSKYLPIYKDFIHFWETTITCSNNEDFENEFEIDEINSLFKEWSKNKTTLSEENIIKILKHFFPNIEIIENKYILNVSCSLWNKIIDIHNSFEYMRQNIKNGPNLNVALISFDDAYKYYHSYCNMNSLKYVVSKRYFEKYLYYRLSEYIVYEKFIETKWLLNA